MIKIKEAIVVEGNYDKIKLSRLFDATIVVLDGYMIYKDRSKQNLLKMLADKCGVIILTDSDMAGFRIRSFLKNILKGKNVKHAYIPDVKGKEKRKRSYSAEGFLGVEGMNDDVLVKAILDAIGNAESEENSVISGRLVTKSDLYMDGLSGNADSSSRRRNLTKMLGLPARISSNMLLDVINSLYSFDEYKMIINTIKQEKL